MDLLLLLVRVAHARVDVGDVAAERLLAGEDPAAVLAFGFGGCGERRALFSMGIGGELINC